MRCCHSHNVLLWHGACHWHVAPPLSYHIAPALLHCHCQGACCFAIVRGLRFCLTHCMCHTVLMLHCHCYVALPRSCRMASIMLCWHALQQFSLYLVLLSCLLLSCGSAFVILFFIWYASPLLLGFLAFIMPLCHFWVARALSYQSCCATILMTLCLYRVAWPLSCCVVFVMHAGSVMQCFHFHDALPLSCCLQKSASAIQYCMIVLATVAQICPSSFVILVIHYDTALLEWYCLAYI